jgi:hypothetical protein
MNTLRMGLLLGLVGLAPLRGTVRAADAPVKEYQVKAAILLQSARFVEWPAEADAPIVVGVLGEDPFGPLLDQIFKGESAKGRPLEIRRFKAPQDLEPCHILFVCASEKERWPEIRKRLGEDAFKARGPLTVSDIEAFAEAGGVLHLDLQEKKVRLRINVDAAARASLKISSQLLKLAVVVRDK